MWIMLYEQTELNSITHYQSINPNSFDTHSVQTLVLESTLLDAEGNQLQLNQSYYVVILAVPDGERATLSTFSKLSDSAELYEFAPQVTDLTLIDIANNSSSSDFRLDINVQEKDHERTEGYAYFIVKSDNDFTLQDALTNQNHIEFSNVDATSTTANMYFNDSVLDSDGDAINENQIYVVYILSKPIGNNAPSLSDPSNSIKLSYTPEVSTLIEASPVHDALSFGTDGYIYGSDVFGNSTNGQLSGNKIYKIATDGTYEIFAEGFHAGPIKNSFDSNGNLYVRSYQSGAINKISPRRYCFTFYNSINTGGWSCSRWK